MGSLLFAKGCVEMWAESTISLNGKYKHTCIYMLTNTPLKIIISWASQVVLAVKNLPANSGDKRGRFNGCVGKIPWRRAWQPIPVFLPGESHGQRSVVGNSPWGRKE